jgi:hypothetical protein
VYLVTICAFLPILENGFVNWDDDQNILKNSRYRGFGWPNLHWMFTTFHMSLYRPLTWLSIAVDELLWGTSPSGYHWTSLVIHALNGLVFYFVTLRVLRIGFSKSSMTREASLRFGAALAALFFSLHPLRVEPIAWASARNDVLSGFFFLTTVLCYLKASTPGQPERAPRYWTIASWALYAFSL